MARPPLPIGTWGRISTKVMKTDDKGKPVSVRAKTNFRDHDGQVRDVTAYAKTATAAERALLKKLQDRAKTGHGGDLTAMHKVNHLIDLWIEKFEEQITDGTRSPSSLDTYLRAIKNHVRPALGELRIGEVNTPRADTVISKIKKNTGPPTAKTCRAIISGMMQLAVRYGAITINPVREVESIEHPAKKPARAIQADEITLLRSHLKADKAAVQADLPDLHSDRRNRIRMRGSDFERFNHRSRPPESCPFEGQRTDLANFPRRCRRLSRRSCRHPEAEVFG